jgi:DNA-binding GntR family transcriptional regulator
VTRLRKACSAGETATVAADTERFVTANNDFHATLAEIAGNPTLAELADFVSRRARWCYRMVAPSRGQESCAEHLELVDAIEDGDRERAAKLAHAHIERTRAVFGSSPGR